MSNQGVRPSITNLTNILMLASAIGVAFILVFWPLGYLSRYAVAQGAGEFIRRLWQPNAQAALLLSLQVALAATAVNAVVGTLMAFVLVRGRFPGKNILDALVDIPLSLPTVVIGFSLLLLYGPEAPMGFLGGLGFRVMFAFPGIVLAHVFVTFPFMVRAVGAVLDGVDSCCEDAARTLGAKPWQTFFLVTLPALREGLVAGAVLTFAKSLGEFGATIMVSGNRPGRTQTAPLYIFSRFNTGDIAGAAVLALALASFSFFVLLFFRVLQSRRKGGIPVE
jgi:sulfate transport system permease protein